MPVRIIEILSIKKHSIKGEQNNNEKKKSPSEFGLAPFKCSLLQVANDCHIEQHRTIKK